MANQTLDNLLYFSNGYGQICANDANHQIAIRADRNGTAGDYTNYYQYGNNLSTGLGHKFWTGGAIASQTLKFQISNDGNYMACPLLIGTTDVAAYHPGFMSHAVDIVGSRPGISLENTSGTLNTIRLKGTSARGEMHINFNGSTCTDGGLYFYTYGCTNRSVLTLGLNGNVGIGIDNPFSPHNGNGLIVKGNGSDTRGIIELHDGGASSGKSVFQNVGGDTYIGQLGRGTGNGDVYLLTGGSGTSATISMAIKCAGNVGIGTTSPSSRLDVCGADGRIQSRVDSSDGSTINVRPNAGKCGWISYTEDAVADRWGIGIKNGDAKLYFSSGNVGSGGGTTRMVLDGNGNLGVGTVSPSVKLEVDSVSNSTNAAAFFASGLTSTNSTYIKVGKNLSAINNSAEFAFKYIADNCATNIASIGFYGNGNILNVLAGGSVGIGTQAPSYKLHVNGTFYAAGSSQDYKQGICQYNTDSCLFMCLKPKTYQYKDEWKHLGKDLKSETQIGLIAEEVAESHPELAILVNEEDNKVVRNVDYEKLSIVLLAEVQKLRQEVDQLKNK